MQQLHLDTSISTLGQAKIPSPLSYCRPAPEDGYPLFIDGDCATGFDAELGTGKIVHFEAAGPRHSMYFDPSKSKCAIVTCGGLCPGINDVIRSIVLEAHHSYAIPSIIGIRYGLQGFIPKYKHPVMDLTPDAVTSIHQFGGTILGSSRGPQPPEDIVDALERMNINCVFMIGGDGTLRAAKAIYTCVQNRGLKIAIIGIPKTIDNDINFISQSFGFETAVDKATEAIQCAHTEAIGAPNGIGLVKLMGRESGFIAVQATLSLKEVNFLLVPEAPFSLEGEGGFLPVLAQRLKHRGHAVIVVAEGAGQHLLHAKKMANVTPITEATDASGNSILGDIASLLREEICRYLKELGMDHNIKFIDPSYSIRSIPATANDRVYCGFLGQHAVHAAMAGRTGMVVARLMDRYVHLPLDLVTSHRRVLNTCSEHWRSVAALTLGASQKQSPIPK
ncbi:MAG: ATP-dependent 6-phosphofructokinase [Pseudomonadota bacterium]